MGNGQPANNSERAKAELRRQFYYDFTGDSETCRVLAAAHKRYYEESARHRPFLREGKNEADPSSVR